jgi:WW domain
LAPIIIILTFFLLSEIQEETSSWVNNFLFTMSIRRATFAATAVLRKQVFSNNVQHMSSKSGTGRRVIKSPKKSGVVKAPPAAKDPWVEVLDSKSGQVYFWNQKTDETTALGAPKPTLQNNALYQAPPQESIVGGLGAVVAQGFAFGVGSSIARSVVGSVMGGSSSDSSGGGDSGGGVIGGGDSGGGDSWSGDSGGGDSWGGDSWGGDSGGSD